MKKQTTISRDPFARSELVRVPADQPGPCRWCGQPGRFAYGVEEDQRPGRAHFDEPFCSVGCFRTYHQ